MGPRAALAVIPALCVVPAAYAIQRLYEVLFVVQFDPAQAPPSPSIALFWRAGVAAALAFGSLGPLFQLGERSPAAAMRLAEASLIVSAVLLAAQALVAP